MLSVIYRKCIPSHLETKHGQVQDMFNSWHHGRERKKEGTGEGGTSRERGSMLRRLILLLNPLQVGMFKVHPEIPESMSAEAKAFILKCFEPDPDKRACANDLLVDEFLKVSSKKKKTQPKLSGML